MHASINTHLSAIYLTCGRLVNRSGQTVAVINTYCVCVHRGEV